MQSRMTDSQITETHHKRKFHNFT